jgi:hypothetical protein
VVTAVEALLLSESKFLKFLDLLSTTLLLFGVRDLVDGVTGITDGTAEGDFVVLFFFWMENGLFSGVLVSEDGVERVLTMLKILWVSIRKLSVCFQFMMIAR